MLRSSQRRILRRTALFVIAWMLGVSSVGVNRASAIAEPQTAQANITWAEPKLNIDLGAGESSSKEITFTSEFKLKKVSVEASSELAPFLSVQPTSIKKVPKNKETSVQLAISIPSNTNSGVYTGTLSIRSRDQSVVLERLTININIWQEYADATFGFKISAPFGSGVSRSQDSPALQVLGLVSPSQTRHEYGGEITVFRWFNPKQQSIDAFFDGNQGPNFANETTAGREAMTIDGKSAVLFKEVTGISTGHILIVRVDPYFLVFQISDDPATFSRILQSIKILN